MIVLGDARQMGLADNSIDAIVTDPPYGLEFMGKEWDRLGDLGKAKAGFSKGAPAVKGVRGEIKALPSYNAVGNVRCRKCNKWKWGHKPGDSGGGGLGCQCEEPDFPNVKAIQAGWMQAWHYTWAIEALRGLKPGGHLLAMGGTRTFHRLACALEDAGFEIRDCMMHLYGSGFPKSYNISKGFDRRAFKEWLDTVELDCCLVRDPRARKAQIRKVISAAVGGVYSDASPGLRSPEGYLRSGGQNTRPWLEDRKVGKTNEGSRYLTSLLCRFWEPLNKAEQHEIWQAIIGDHKDCDVGMPPGGRVKSGINPHTEGRSERTFKGIAAAGQPKTIGGNVAITAPSTPLAKEWEGFGSGLKPAWEPVIVARKPLCGTLCENFEKWGTGGLNIDESRIATIDKLQKLHGSFSFRAGLGANEKGKQIEFVKGNQGRWPANLILSHSEDCVRVGMRRVKAVGQIKSTVTPYSSGRTMHISDTPDDGRNRWYADPDGYEQVEDWICVESCPVRLLDEQSKEKMHGAGIARKRDVASKYDASSYHAPEIRQMDRYGDSGGASRFFKNIEPDKYCILCGLTMAREHGIMSARQREVIPCESVNTVIGNFNPVEEEDDSVVSHALLNGQQDNGGKLGLLSISVPNVAKNSQNTQAISENIAQRLVKVNLIEGLVQNVKSAASLCDLCAIAIAQSLVAIKHGHVPDSLLGLDFINEHKEQILIQSLVSFAELWGRSDTIPTIASLKMFFGSVRDAMRNSIPTSGGEKDSGPLRFRYQSKASRAERTCQGTVENKEPTVKPVNLCRYLERLVARPGAVILDPFCGSGTFGVAAVLEGFNWIGIDNRLEACQIAKKRREWAIQQKGGEGQPRLF